LWDGTPLVPGSGTYLLNEFLADIDTGHRVDATVYVEVASMYRADGPESLRPVGEVEFANGVAAMSASGRYGRARVGAGIVGYADLTLGDRVTDVLEALVAAGNGRLRGVRNMSATDADRSIYPAPRPEGLLRDASFRAGFARLASFGLTFDAWLHHPQLDEVIDLAREFPETSIIVDHAGGPLRIGRYASCLEQSYADWKSAIERLARCPNISMKLGGLGMRYLGMPGRDAGGDSSAFLAAKWRPLIEPCIEAFGTSRCMFESNFPVDRHTCSYPVLWNAFKRITSQCSASEKADLYRETAARVYHLVF
jgi:predicted TIM-barrel fold metal-dependent hydrolase